MRWNKIVFGMVVGAALLANAPFLSAQTSGLKQAIIVIRHGEDLPGKDSTPPLPWKTKQEELTDYWKATVCPTWPVYEIAYQLVDSSGIKKGGPSVAVAQHGLNPVDLSWKDAEAKAHFTESGEAQARFLAERLGKFLKDNGYAAISLAITKSPIVSGGKWPTPNPFDTIYPFLKANPSCMLYLVKAEPYPEEKDAEGRKIPNKRIVDQGLDNLLQSQSLLGTAGSTLICWDREGLWGSKKEGGRFILDDTSILRQLTGESIGNELSIRNLSPAKGRTVYLFTKRDSTGPGTGVKQKYNLDVVVIKAVEPATASKPATQADFPEKYNCEFVVNEKDGSIGITAPQLFRDPAQP